MFQFISADPVICARYHYCEMKCNNDIWLNITKPLWFENIKKIIMKKKKKLIANIDR